VPVNPESSVHEKFIFTAGSIHPARGLEDMLIAFSSIHDQKPNVKLVIAGSTDSYMNSYKSKHNAMITKLGITHGVEWAGTLPEREMSWCYRNCDAFVVTNRAEACPNVVLEAMVHGCICVSTETPPMPELFRDVAAYYPPKDERMLSKVIQKVLSWGKEKRYEMSEQAIDRASQFSWDVCAEKTVAELKTTIENFTLRKRGKHTDAAMCRY